MCVCYVQYMQQSLQVKITPYSTPLFKTCSKATPLSPSSSSSTPSPSYLLLPYTPFHNPQRHNHICPTHSDPQNQHTLIQLQGECLHKFVLSRLHCVGPVMEESDVWALVACLCEGFLWLLDKGVSGGYRHLREYCVRRVQGVSGYVYKLIYHEDMVSQLQLAKSGQTPWHTLYLSPQQLTHSFQPHKSPIFSLGVLLLHICSHQDRSRPIYKKDKYEIDPDIIRYKLALARERYGYSRILLQFVSMCLEPDWERRRDWVGVWGCLGGIVCGRRGKFWGVVAGVVGKREQQEQEEEEEEDSPTVIEYKTDKKQGKLSIPLPQQMVEPSSSQTQQQEPRINRSSMSSPIHRFYHYEDGSDNEQEVKQLESVPIAMKTDRQKIDNPTSIAVDQPPAQTPTSSSTYTYTLHSLPIPPPLTSLPTLKLPHCLHPLTQLIKQINKLGLWTEGDIYYGDLVDGKREGLGLQIYANEEYYYGYFQGDLYWGDGLYLWTESQYFFGRFQRGGKVWGRLQGGVKYQGEFKENRRHGMGTCWYPSGEVYSGQWKNGKRHGQGFVIEPEGPKFVGIWQQGKRKGQGYLETPIMRIAGYWNNEQIEGETLIEYSNGDAFKGTTNSNLQRVEGDLISSSGEIFTGTFQDNQPKLGKLVYRNGDYYIGELSGMRRHGYGEYHYSNGQICKGIWQTNILLQKK